MTYYKRDGGMWNMQYESNVGEALHRLTKDNTFLQTGSVAFEGIFTLIELVSDVTVMLSPESAGRERTPVVVPLPAGTYLMREDARGHVDAYHYDAPVIATTEFEMAEAYFERWTDGEVGV